MTMQIISTSQHKTMPIMAGGALSITSLEIAELVESRHDKVRQSIERLAERGVISLPPLGEVKIQRERRAETVKVYIFSGEQGKRDSIIVVAQLSPEFTARLVDRWQELERKVSGPVLPNFANPADAARAWAEQYEARLIAERTKAEIGSRREATAMATASAAARKARRLEAELDQSMQYASIKRMEMLYHGQKFNWRILKSTATEMGIQSIDIFDANYGTVKAYHADVWREAYALEINQTEVE